MVQSVFKQFRRARAFERDPLEQSNRLVEKVSI